MPAAWFCRSPPALRRSVPCPAAILTDRGRRGLQSKFGHLNSNAWATPSRINRPHAADDLDQFRVLPGAITPSAGFPSPDILNPARCQPVTVSGRKIINVNFQFGQALLSIIQKTPVPRTKLRPAPLPFKHRDLVSQGENLHGQFVLRSKQGPRVNQNGPEHFKLTGTAWVAPPPPLNHFDSRRHFSPTGLSIMWSEILQRPEKSTIGGITPHYSNQLTLPWNYAQAIAAARAAADSPGSIALPHGTGENRARARFSLLAQADRINALSNGHRRRCRASWKPTPIR